ncbi:MAG: hypothetical protein ACREOO_20315 [bacterium]
MRATKKEQHKGTKGTEFHRTAEPQPKRLLDADQNRFTQIYATVSLRYLRPQTLLKMQSFPSLDHKARGLEVLPENERKCIATIRLAILHGTS